MPMMVPRDSSPLTVFIQISLATHDSPSAQPLKNLKNNQEPTLGHSGITGRISAAMPIPAITQRFNPRRAMRRGYSGPSRITAIRLEAITAPIAKLEKPERLMVSAISGGWKPKINPTPRLEENTAARVRCREALFKGGTIDA